MATSTKFVLETFCLMVDRMNQGFRKFSCRLLIEFYYDVCHYQQNKIHEPFCMSLTLAVAGYVNVQQAEHVAFGNESFQIFHSYGPPSNPNEAKDRSSHPAEFQICVTGKWKNHYICLHRHIYIHLYRRLSSFLR